MLRSFESPAPPAGITRVIVIGGGAAGLSALSALSKTPGTQVILLERHPAIGGVWHTANYPELATHIKSYAYRFHDFRAPECKTDYAKRDEVLKYFSDYVDANGLGAHIQTGIRVRTITCSENVVIESETSDGRPLHLHCDFVVCALGFTNAGEPHLPSFQGRDTFQGQIVHSSEFDDAFLETLAPPNRRAVLLGGGKSAYDLASLFRRRGLADRLTWVYRKFLWGLNHQQLYSADAEQLQTSLLVGQFLYRQRRSPHDPTLAELATTILESGIYLNLEDNHALHQFRGAHYDPQEISMLRQTIRRHVSSVQRLGRSSVHLDSGEEIEADLLICATGYQRGKNLPEIRKIHAGESTHIDPCNQKLLYRSMVDPRLPRVLFFTGETTFPSHLYGFSVCSRWLPFYMQKVLRGEISGEEMARQATEDDAVLNAGVAPAFVYSWIPPQGRNFSGGADYSGIEASALYRKQVHTDLGIHPSLQAQLSFSLFQPEAFERANAALHESTKTLPHLGSKSTSPRRA